MAVEGLVGSAQQQLRQGGLYRDAKSEARIYGSILNKVIYALEKLYLFLPTDKFGEERITANALFPVTSRTTACKYRTAIRSALG